MMDLSKQITRRCDGCDKTILTQKLNIENEFEQVLNYHGYINYNFLTNFLNQYKSRCYLFSKGIINGVLDLFAKASFST